MRGVWRMIIRINKSGGTAGAGTTAGAEAQREGIVLVEAMNGFNF